MFCQLSVFLGVLGWFHLFLGLVDHFAKRARIGLEVLVLEHYSHHRGQRVALSLLQASDLKSEDFQAENAKRV